MQVEKFAVQRPLRERDEVVGGGGSGGTPYYGGLDG